MFKSKIAAVGVALSLASSFAFAEAEVSFSNKLSSDIVNITKEGDADSESTFAGIKNKTTFEYSSEKVDAGIELVFWSIHEDVFEEGEKYFGIGANEDPGFGYDFGDTFVEVRPFDFLGFEFHEKVWATASYFPIWDDNASTGNLGSDLGLLIRPVEGLTLAGGIDFFSVFGHDTYKPVVNFGAAYTNDVFELAATVKNICDNKETDVNNRDGFAFGVYASLLKIEGLVLGAGFGYNDSVAPDVTKIHTSGKEGVSGNIMTLTATYELDAFHTAGEFATNFTNNKEDAEYDFYLAVTAGYNVLENLSADCAFAAALDAESDEEKKVENVYQINPSVTYTLGNHELSAGVNIFYGKDYSNVNFPVYWKYSF